MAKRFLWASDTAEQKTARNMFKQGVDTTKSTIGMDDQGLQGFPEVF